MFIHQHRSPETDHKAYFSPLNCLRGTKQLELIMFKPSLLAASVAACSSFAVYAETVLPTTVVTAARLAQPSTDVIGDVTVLNRDTLSRYSGQSVADTLMSQAGLQLSNNGGTGKTTSFFIRGANASHTLVLIDGVRYGSATLGSAAIQDLPVDQIERIEILRGSAASLYGSDAIGGVIQIFTRKHSTQPVSVSVGIGSLGTYQGSLSGNVKSGATQAAMTLAHSETDNINAITNPKNAYYYADEDGYRNTSLSVNASHSINSKNSLGASVLLAQTTSQYDGAVYDTTFKPVGQYYNYRNEGQQSSAALWSSHQLSSMWSSKVQVGQSIDRSNDYSPVSATDFNDKKSVFTTRQQQLSWQNDVALNTNSTVSIVAESLQQKVSGTTDYAVSKRRINSVQAGYVAHIDSINLQTNIRHDDNSQFGKHTTYLAGASYSFLQNWEVGTTLSTGFSAPSFNNLYFPFYGDPLLKPEKSRNIETFVRFNAGGINSSLTLYRNVVRDLIQYDSSTFGPNNIGKANLEGATFTTNWQSQLFNSGLQLDLLDAQDASGRANDGKQLVRRARKTGLVYAGLQQQGWQVRAEVQGQGKRYDNAANTHKLGGYSLLNANASWQVSPELTLGLRLNNILDKSYVLAKDYGTLGRTGLMTLTWQPK